jgi:DNA-binding HxlR family transcriptional regulator
MRKQRHDPEDAALPCPIELALDVMGGKWKAVILYRLSGRTVRFSALKRELCRITQRTLTQQLREMEADGLISRQIYAEVPPRVEYALTDRGQSLLPALNALRVWSETYLPAVPQAAPETFLAS